MFKKVDLRLFWQTGKNYQLWDNPEGDVDDKHPLMFDKMNNTRTRL